MISFIVMIFYTCWLGHTISSRTYGRRMIEMTFSNIFLKMHSIKFMQCKQWINSIAFCSFHWGTHETAKRFVVRVSECEREKETKQCKFLRNTNIYLCFCDVPSLSHSPPPSSDKQPHYLSRQSVALIRHACMCVQT